MGEFGRSEEGQEISRAPDNTGCGFLKKKGEGGGESGLGELLSLD